LVPLVSLTGEQYHAIFATLDDFEARADQRAARRRASRLEESIEAEVGEEDVSPDANGEGSELKVAASA
jgi:hypothetical protein